MCFHLELKPVIGWKGERQDAKPTAKALETPFEVFYPIQIQVAAQTQVLYSMWLVGHRKLSECPTEDLYFLSKKGK